MTIKGGRLRTKARCRLSQCSLLVPPLHSARVSSRDPGFHLTHIPFARAGSGPPSPGLFD